MPSTYTVNLGIEKPATGEQSGTWGDTTNVNFDILDQAINGAERVTLTSAGSSGSPNSLQITNGATSDGRNKWLEFYSSSDLGGSAFVQLDPNDAEKIVFVRNSLAGSQSVILFQGTYNAARDLEVPAGVDMVVKFDGGGASAATVTDVFTKLRATEITTPTLTATTADINGGTIDNSVIGGSTAAAVTGTTVVANTSLNIAGDGATVTGIKDEDDMSSNSPTKLATQQSIKAYVDSQVGTVDTWAEVLANGATSGSTNPEVTAGQALKTNTINETTAGSGVTIDSVLLKDDVVNATDIETSTISANDGTAAATIANSTGNFTITNFISGSVDINGGSIDGTNIGANSAGTGAFTTITGSGDMAIDTDTLFVDVSADRVGINEDEPDEALVVKAAEYSGNINGGIAVQAGDHTGTHWKSAFKIASTSGGVPYTVIEATDSGTSGSTFDAINIWPTEVVINENSADRDFRVESDGASHMLFVDAGNNRVGINNSAPAKTLHVSQSGTPEIRVQNSDNNYALDLGMATTVGQIKASADLALMPGGIEKWRVDTSGNVTQTNTSAGAGAGPYLNLHRNSASPLAGDALGIIQFQGEDSVGNLTSYATISSEIYDPNNGTEDGRLVFKTAVTGSLANRLYLNFAETVFNEDSNDLDFRVESNGNTHAIFVNAGADGVGFGATASTVGSSTIEGMYYEIGGSLTVASNTETLQINRNNTGGNNRVNIGLYNNGTKRGEIGTYGAADGMFFYTGSTIDSLRLTAGEAVFNDGGDDVNFRVESNNNQNMFFVDAGNDRIGVNTSSPSDAMVHVANDIDSASYRDVNSIIYNLNGSITENQAREMFRITADAARRSCQVRITFQVYSPGGVSNMSGGSMTCSIWKADGDVSVRVEEIHNGSESSGSVSMMLPTISGDIVTFGMKAGNNGTSSTYTVNTRIELVSNTPSDFTVADYSAANATATGSQYNGGFLLAALDGSDELSFNKAGNRTLVVNEDSYDRDFRVESDSNTHALFVDAGNSRVGVNVATPIVPFSVAGTPDSAYGVANFSGGAGQAFLTISRDGSQDGGFKVLRGTTPDLRLYVQSDESSVLNYNGGNTGDSFFIVQGAGTGALVATFDSGNNIIFNDNSGNQDFRVESDSNANMIFVDASANAVGIGKAPDAAGNYALDVNGAIRFGDGNVVAGICYPHVVTTTRSVGSGSQWYKVYSETTSPSPRTVYLRINASGDNSSFQGDFIINLAGYNFQHSIVLTDYQYYNVAKLEEIKTVNPGSATTTEIWVRVNAISGSTGTLTAQCSSSALVSSLSAGSEPSATLGTAHLYDDSWPSNSGRISTVFSNGAEFADASVARFRRQDGARSSFINHDTGGMNIATSDVGDNMDITLAGGSLDITLIDNYEMVVNEGSAAADFRVESNDYTHMFVLDGGTNEITIGGSNNAANATVALNNISGKHGKSIHSSNTISGSQEAAIMAEGTFAVNTTSAGTTLSIPVFSQSSVWRRYTVEFMFTSGEYNDSGNGKYGTATIKFASLNSISQIFLAASTGNVASVSSSGMNVQINFTSGYTGGLSNYEGLLVYYRVLGSHPSYFQTWNASLN